MTPPATLGIRELDVMTVLWARGSGTVEEVRTALDANLAYTTVLSILRNLEAKQFLRHDEEGRVHRFFPRLQQETAQTSAVSRLVETLFAGSPTALIAKLVDDHGVTPGELERLAKVLSKRGSRARHDIDGDSGQT